MRRQARSALYAKMFLCEVYKSINLAVLLVVEMGLLLYCLILDGFHCQLHFVRFEFLIGLKDVVCLFSFKKKNSD